VSDQPRISTVTAATDCEFWVLARPHFEAFFNRHPRMARNLAAALVRRLQEKDQDFTSQSTLALERARLLSDLQQGTAELAALADVTRALNASLDLDETLQTISTYAARLTTSDTALIFLYDEGRDVLTVRASYNAPAGYLAEIGERPIPRDAARSREVPSDCSLTVCASSHEGRRFNRGHGAVHRHPNRALLLRWGYRAVLVVPLLHDERVIGAMSVLRVRAGEFTAREIELVMTFASHSAIAIEHARLFQEVQAQNRALKEALEHQTVTSEFLKGINRTTFELQPMLETLVEHATDLCGAAGGLIFTLAEGAYRWAADYAPRRAFRRLREPYHPGRGDQTERQKGAARPFPTCWQIRSTAC
jgi:transcriptional regulator with GAF, ATPase, and Fis domain